MERNHTHLAGEYFVAAELYRRGFSVVTNGESTTATGLLANKDSRTISIQVKAIRNRRSVGWSMIPEKVESGIMYIFVNLNDKSAPDYYICTPNEAKVRVKQYSTGGIIDLSALGSTQLKDRWDKLETHRFLETPPPQPQLVIEMNR